MSKGEVAEGGHPQPAPPSIFCILSLLEPASPQGWRCLAASYSVIGFILWHECRGCKCHSLTPFLNMLMTSESMGIWISRARYFSFQEEEEKTCTDVITSGFPWCPTRSCWARTLLQHPLPFPVGGAGITRDEHYCWGLTFSLGLSIQIVPVIKKKKSFADNRFCEHHT